MSNRRRMMIKRRKQVQRNRKIVLITGIILSLILISMTIGNIHVGAHQNTYKYYTDVIIESGDTLWSIADQYCGPEYSNVHDYIKEVRSINNLGTTIYPGQRIVVPYYSSELK